MKWFICVLAFGFAVNMPGWAAKMGKEKQPKTPPLHHLVDIAVPDSMQLDSRLPLQTDRMLKCPVCHGNEELAAIESLFAPEVIEEIAHHPRG